MADETPTQERKSSRPLGIGLFWFTTLLTATVLATGCVSLPGQLPWGATHSPAPLTAAEPLPARSDPIQTTAEESGVAIGSIPRFDEPLGGRLDAPDPRADRSRADSESRRTVPEPDSIIPDGIRSESPVDVGPPASVSVSIVGPRRRTVGSRAEYVITFINDSGFDLPDADVRVSYGSALQLKEVSAGAVREPGLLRWDLGTFLKEERIQVQLEFECVSTVWSAPLIASVASSRHAAGTAEAGLTVSARPALELRLSDMADPLEFGQQSTFLLEVFNHTSEPARDIVIHLVPSGNIQVSGALVRHGNLELNLDAFVEETGLYFEAAPPLNPGERLSYEIEFNARAAGTSELRAIMQSRDLNAPVEVREPIVINPRLTND